MAFKGKLVTKQEEVSQKRQPDFNIRVKIKEASDDEKEVWMTIGAMWSAKLSDGKTGWFMRFNSFPPLWNGDALAMPPLPEKG
jgi:hypothetical protein